MMSLPQANPEHAPRSFDGPAVAGLLLGLSVIAFMPWIGMYYYYDDGRLLIQGVRMASEGWRVAFEGGFFGRLRPLPISSVAVVQALFGLESPALLHLLAIGLHAANTVLVWHVMKRLLPSAGGAALATACLFAVHWYATGAVLYIAAIGMLWSMLGGLVAALGVAGRGDRPASLTALLIVVGAMLAFGGGEYGVATWMWPLVALLVRRPARNGLPWRRPAMLSVLLLPLAAYIILYMIYLDRGQVGSIYRIGAHSAEALANNIARLTFPSAWLDERIALPLMVMLVGAGVAASPRFRRRVLDRTGSLLLLGTLGALLPFAPSTTGNHAQYTYAAAPLFLAWLARTFSITLDTPRVHPARRRIVVRWTAAGMIAIHLIQMHGMTAVNARRATRVADLIRQIDTTRGAEPGRPLSLFVINDIEAAIETAVALGRVAPANAFHGEPAGHPAADELWVLARYDLASGFKVKVHRADTAANHGG